MSLIMIYGNLSEYITTGYKMEEGEEFHFRELFLGQFAGFWWYYVIGGLVVPPLLILIPWTRNIWGIVVAALRVPLMSYDPSNYAPTWVEWSIVAASFALFALLITVFIKVFPILAVWEVAEQQEEAVMAEPAHRLQPRLASESAGGAL
jgi:molybdopterin-containing oxidoreductase family membrane subunit